MARPPRSASTTSARRRDRRRDLHQRPTDDGQPGVETTSRKWTATVSWLPLSDSTTDTPRRWNGGCSSITYTMTMSPCPDGNDDCEWGGLEPTTVDGESKVRVDVVGLSPKTEYTYSVVANQGTQCAPALDSSPASTKKSTPDAIRPLPVTPKDIAVTNADYNTCFDFTWLATTDNGGSAVASYKYTIKGQTNGETYADAVCDPAASDCSVPSTPLVCQMVPGTDITISVVVTNAAGLSSTPLPVNWTVPVVNPQPVDDASITEAKDDENPGKVDLAWAPVPDGYGSHESPKAGGVDQVICTYYLQATKTETDPDVVDMTAATSTIQANITALDPGVSYLFKIKVGACDSGKNSSEASKRGPTSAEKPSGLKAPNGAAKDNTCDTAIFSLPDGAVGDDGDASDGSQIVSITFEWRHIPANTSIEPSETWSSTGALDPTLTGAAAVIPHTQSGLTKNAKYELRFIACNAEKCSAASPTSFFTTNPCDPYKPVVSLDDIDADSGVFTWTGPGDLGGEIQDNDGTALFKVYLQSVQSTSDSHAYSKSDASAESLYQIAAADRPAAGTLDKDNARTQGWAAFDAATHRDTPDPSPPAFGLQAWIRGIPMCARFRY
eukprot:tig00021349_g20617.t1